MEVGIQQQKVKTARAQVISISVIPDNSFFIFSLLPYNTLVKL